jgi:hypothetical protein
MTLRAIPATAFTTTNGQYGPDDGSASTIQLARVR